MQLVLGEFSHHPKIVHINDVEFYLSASLINSKTGQSEFQFLISFNNPSKAKKCYIKRCKIDHALALNISHV